VPDTLRPSTPAPFEDADDLLDLMALDDVRLHPRVQHRRRLTLLGARVCGQATDASSVAASVTPVLEEDKPLVLGLRNGDPELTKEDWDRRSVLPPCMAGPRASNPPPPLQARALAREPAQDAVL
jgi:hypothetical protein